VNTLSKALLTEKLINELNLDKNDAGKIIIQFFEQLRYALEHGKHVKLSSFGNFILRDKAERPGRNPKTGKDIPVAARRVVTFKPGLKLRKQIEKILN
jgi:integration host factor subunit alpha